MGKSCIFDWMESLGLRRVQPLHKVLHKNLQVCWWRWHMITYINLKDNQNYINEKKIICEWKLLLMQLWLKVAVIRKLAIENWIFFFYTLHEIMPFWITSDIITLLSSWVFKDRYQLNNEELWDCTIRHSCILVMSSCNCLL